MEEDKWNDRMPRVRLWLGSPENKDWPLIGLVNNIIHLGDESNNSLVRNHFWTLIVNLFRGVEKAPFGGRPPTWGWEMDTKVTILLDDLYSLFHAIFDNEPQIEALVLPHGKSSAAFFDAASYAKHICTVSRMQLMKAWKNHHNGIEDQKYYWDGSFDTDGMPMIEAPPVQSDGRPNWDAETVRDLIGSGGMRED